MMCPQCKAKLGLVTDGEVGSPVMPGFMIAGDPMQMEMKFKPFWACSTCEYCVEELDLTPMSNPVPEPDWAVKVIDKSVTEET